MNETKEEKSSCRRDQNQSNESSERTDESIENIDGYPKELEDLQEMWNSFYIDLIATRKSENSPWFCFGLVFKLSNQIFPYKTEIRYNLDDRLIIAHHCEKFSFDRFMIVLREIVQGALTLDTLQFKIENFDMRHFILKKRTGWNQEGLTDEEGWPAHIFRSYSHDWELINGLQELDKLLIMHEEPYSSIPELTRKYLHGIEIGGAKAGAIYGVIPRYFKFENSKLDKTGTIDVNVESHMRINPSDLMISVIIKDESNDVLHSYIVPLDMTQYRRSKESFWVINKHINNNLKGVSEASLRLAYKKSIVVYEDWIQVSEIISARARTASFYADFPISQLTRYSKDELERYWMKLSAQKRLDTKLKIENTASKITKLMGVTNLLFQSKQQATLFRDDQPYVIAQLFTTCEDSDSLAAKIAGLCSLFEVKRGPLRRLVSSPGDLGTIGLVRKWLDEEVIQYNPDMIECWIKIRQLRNSTPIHPRKLKDIMEILDFFELTTTIDSEKVWNSVINKFLESLEEWHSILSTRAPRREMSGL